MWKKILSFIIFILVAFTVYLLYNTLTFKSKQISVAPAEHIEISDLAKHHLSEAIKIKTVSYENPADIDSAEFTRFINFIRGKYPQVEQHLTKKIINEFSLLFEWPGKNPQLDPVVLVAHMDVVPVPEEEMAGWSSPPFSGEIRNGILWGRGAMDDKVSVIGILEAVEQLLKNDFQPERTVYLAFGHDEEIGGRNGAGAIANHLKARNIRPEFVLDEGFAVTQGLVPGVLTDVALIGIAEKGFASLTLSVELHGGHSSMPNAETAIEVIANAITRLEEKPFPAKITAPVQQFLEHVGPEMRFQEKLVFANNKLFKSVILGIYQQTGPGRAVVQTTMVPTVFNSGIKENVVPSTASAIINFRILPGTTIEDVMEHVRKSIQDDRIHIQLRDFHSEPSKVSSIDTYGYSAINQTIKEIFREAITVPNLVIAATDGRHYGPICNNVYRFLPIHLNQENINVMHGIDERIPIDEFEDAVRFYIQLIKNCK